MGKKRKEISARMRERDELIKKLYMLGMTDPQIAQTLQVSPHTVCASRSRQGLNFIDHNEQKCWTCQNSYADKCPWFIPGAGTPVPGWTAAPTEIKYRHRTISSYKISDCPQFEPLEG